MLSPPKSFCRFSDPVPLPTDNEEQIRFWSEEAGPQWVAEQALLDQLVGPSGLAAIDRAGLQPGQSVLDVGCGTGQTTVEIAKRVGVDGRVVGLDVSGVMLEAARQRAKTAAVAATFLEADAQVAPLPHRSFDTVFSRFGVMFFSDPRQAFSNFRGALKPDGCITFLCWQAVSENPWVAKPLAAMAEYVPLPEPPPKKAPGEFSFSQRERILSVLSRSGFVDIDLHDLRTPLVLEAELAVAVDFFSHLGPAASLLREAEEGVAEKAKSALARVLEAHHEQGKLTMDAAIWLVTACLPQR